MISVYGEDGDGNIEVWVFIIDGWKARRVTIGVACPRSSSIVHARVSGGFPIVWVAQKLDLDGAVSKRVLSEEGHDLIQTVS